MFTHPDLAGQLAREHHRQMQAAVSQRQLQRQHGHQERLADLCHQPQRDAPARAARRARPHQSGYLGPALPALAAESGVAQSGERPGNRLRRALRAAARLRAVPGT